MKLVLDSKALERLLGGDETLEIELKTNIANQFAEKHLKSLVSSQLMLATKGKIEGMIKEEITGNAGGWNINSISQKYQDIILFTLKTALMGLIELEVKKVLDSGNYKELVDNFVKQEASRIANEWTSGDIEKRIQKAADDKIREKLGLKQ